MRKIFILIVLVICICLFCGYSSTSHKNSSLPINATNIIDIGNDWTIFSVGDKKFMYHKRGFRGRGYECVTQIK